MNTHTVSSTRELVVTMLTKMMSMHTETIITTRTKEF